MLLALIYVLGILWGQYDNIFFMILFLTLVLYKIGEIIKKGGYIVALVWSVICISLFVFSYLNYNYSSNFRDKYLDKLEDEDTIEVAGELYKKEMGDKNCKYYLQECSIREKNKFISCNNILVYTEKDKYCISDMLLIKGKIKLFPEASNQGMFNLKRHYLSQKIDFSVYEEKVQKFHKSNFIIPEKIYLLKCKLRKSIYEITNKQNAGILSSMFLGDKSDLNDDIKSLYQITGISHILAISGLHLSLIGMVVYRILRYFRKSFAFSAIIASVFVLVYLNLSGESISAQRATGMMILVLIANIIGRSNDLLNSLGIVVLLLLCYNPFLIGYGGFIFSVMAILGVGISSEVLVVDGENIATDKKSQIKIRVYNKFACSIGIWLFTMPIVAYFYYEIPLYSLFLNIIILFLLSYVFLFGIAGMLIGTFCRPIGKILIYPSSFILNLYEHLCKLTTKLPFNSLITGKCSISRLFIYYIVLFMILSFLYFVKKRKYDKIRMLIIPIIVPIFLLMVCVNSGMKNQFEIDILDVGQGDGSFISTGDNVTYFIDGGSSDVKNVGKNRIIPFLKSRCIRKIDYWFVSHTDDDHISGLEEVLEQGYKVDYLVMTKGIHKDDAYLKLTQLAKKNDTELVFMGKGDCVKTSTTKIECIYPYGNESSENKNDLSMVLKFSKEGVSCLFTGDISSEIEEKLIKEKILEDIYIYKVAHHGSKYSSSEVFLDKIKPKISTISCSKKNRYGHPNIKAINNIKKTGSKVYYTMKNGQIIISKNEKGVSVNTFVK